MNPVYGQREIDSMYVSKSIWTSKIHSVYGQKEVDSIYKLMSQ